MEIRAVTEKDATDFARLNNKFNKTQDTGQQIAERVDAFPSGEIDLVAEANEEIINFACLARDPLALLRLCASRVNRTLYRESISAAGRGTSLNPTSGGYSSSTRSRNFNASDGCPEYIRAGVLSVRRLSNTTGFSDEQKISRQITVAFVL